MATYPSDAGAPDDAAIRERAARLEGTFSPAQRLLRRFSKDPVAAFRAPGYSEPTLRWNDANALDFLRQEFQDFDVLIRGRRVLDYGCGDGFQAIAAARAGAAEVLGVDLLEQRLAHGRKMAVGLPNVRFATTISGDYDVAISLNAFEHFPDPTASLAELGDSIRPGGRILLSFGPPWFAPYGAHMHFFTPVPWVHLLFTKRTVLRVRDLYRDDPMHSYVPSMNRMSIRRFEQIVAQSGLRVESLRYRSLRGLPLLARIPIVRELFIIHVTCILAK